MSIKSKMVTFFAAGVLVSSIAAQAQRTTDPDPNVAPSTAGEEAEIPATGVNVPQTASDPDPNFGPSTTGEEAQIPGTAANVPETASDPDPNVGPSTTGEEDEIQSSAMGHSSAPAAAVQH